MKRITLIFSGILAVVSLSCKKSIYVAPQLPDTVSFKTHIIPIFNNNCNNSSCHGGALPQGNLNLESAKAYSQLWSKEMVDTLHPDQSLLYSAMISVSKPMPPSGRLDTFYIKEVLRWIEQGAKDN